MDPDWVGSPGQSLGAEVKIMWVPDDQLSNRQQLDEPHFPHWFQSLLNIVLNACCEFIMSLPFSRLPFVFSNNKLL